MTLAMLLPRRTGVASSSRRRWFFTLYVVGCAGVATATGYLGYGAAALRVPHAVQVVLGLLMVFVVPGWALVWAAFPKLQSWVERVLASVGISIVVSTCAAVLLAATPVGFSRQPFGVVLGGIAVALSFGGYHRAQLAAAVEELRARAVGESQAWAKKLSIGTEHGAPRPYRSAKPLRHAESDTRQSVVVLRFSFDHKHADTGSR
jgi:hypothetical protein